MRKKRKKERNALLAVAERRYKQSFHAKIVSCAHKDMLIW